MVYSQECVMALQGAGFTGLASLISQVNGSETGHTLSTELSNDENYTLFALDNEARMYFFIYIVSTSTYFL